MQFHQSTVNNNVSADQLQSQHIKRMRTGSISGRLRTASDLEDSGVIDKYQKGIIKDLIISGDIALQQSLDKCEKGDTSSLTDLIKRGCLARKQSIDLLDGLDFDFLNGIKTEDDDLGYVFDDDLMFDFVNDQFMSGAAANGSSATGGASTDPTPRRVGSTDVHDDKHQRNHNARTSSMDSFSGNFRMFDNMTMFRGHSFGDEANLLMNGTDIDNLYNEDERYEEGGLDDNNGNLYSIGHHHSAFTDELDQPTAAATMTKRPSKKQSEGFPANGNVDMSAYENHAVSLRNNHSALENNTSKPNLKGRHNRGVSKGSTGLDLSHEHLATTTGNHYRQFTDHPSFAFGLKATGFKNGDAMFGGSVVTGRKSKGIPTFNQFSNAAHGVTNFGAAASGFNEEEKINRSVGINGGGLLAYKLSVNNVGGPGGGIGFIGAYSPEQRRLRIEKFFEKRNRRVWTKKVKYDVRKNFADSRLRIKGRFVKKEDEDIMRELLDI